MRTISTLLAIGALLLVGCSGDDGDVRLMIEGKVHNAGQPLHVEGKDVGLGRVDVEFYALDEQGNTAADPLETAFPDEAGRFDLVDGIPPGKYLIAVHQWDPYPQVDRLEGKLSRENSKLIKELTSEDQTLDIDVSQVE